MMHARRNRAFDLSLIVPCYNEQDVLVPTVQRLLAAFRTAGHRLEIIGVDNGSRDRTGALLAKLAAADEALLPLRIEVNEGYGNGVVTAIPKCSAPWIGIIPADGQVDAEDVVRLYETATAYGGYTLAKVRRRFRMDGLARKLVSTTYNLFFRLLWPRIASLDINGSPKIIPRDVALHIKPSSKTWLLDAEIMIKAHAAGIPVIEMNVFARMRGNGVSHVRPAACWEFLYGLLRFRLRDYSKWKKELKLHPIARPTAPHAGEQIPAGLHTSRDPATAHSGPA